jgi:3-oxoacyl-[acyl-carrier protein] reductase
MKKVAVVIGGARRIGRAIARRLALDGFVIVVSYLGDADGATRLVAEINRMGGSASAIRADVANQFWVRAFFAEIVKVFGGIDVVVNNPEVLRAPSAGEGGTLDDGSASSLRGTYLVLDQAGRHVADGGRIILVSAGAQASPYSGNNLYMTPQSRVEAYLHTLASELRERNVSVNVIACEPWQARGLAENDAEEQAIYVARLNPFEPLEPSADIAGIVSLLAGPDGHLVTSQVLYANCSAA